MHECREKRIELIFMVVLILMTTGPESEFTLGKIYRSIGQRLATSSTAIVMLNHFSRTGSASQDLSTDPKPAQPDTQGTRAMAKASKISITVWA